MTADRPEAAPPALEWTDSGAPRATRFDDVYYSAVDGRGETRHVFVDGARLIERWRRAPSFAIGELGFGVGLNFFEILTLWEADRAARPAGARLDYVAFERWPPTADDVLRAMRPWPDLTAVAEQALGSWRREGAWPPPAGWRRVALSDDVALTLAIGDARTLLPAWSAPSAAPARLDAWLLDGFSPAKNPELWGAELLAAVADRSAPSATLASYTAAGWVRRNLSAAGFRVEKRPGFGAKRDMLVATVADDGAAAVSRRRPND